MRLQSTMMVSRIFAIAISIAPAVLMPSSADQTNDLGWLLLLSPGVLALVAENIIVSFATALMAALALVPILLARAGVASCNNMHAGCGNLLLMSISLLWICSCIGIAYTVSRKIWVINTARRK